MYLDVPTPRKLTGVWFKSSRLLSLKDYFWHVCQWVICVCVSYVSFYFSCLGHSNLLPMSGVS